jgi:hypothetical protein
MADQTSAAKSQARGPIRVTLSAKVAYSPDELKKGIAGLMERIGCPRCFSGADCTFMNDRRFVLEAGNKIAAGPVEWREADPEISLAKGVTVGLARGVRHDINKVFKAVDKVIDLIGPHPCISGFDVFFKDVMNTVIINENLEGQRFDANF